MSERTSIAENADVLKQLESLMREVARERSEKELITLMYEESTLRLGNFTIDLPEDIDIPEESLSKMSRYVEEYNSRSFSTERSGSISNEDSVHYLWRQLLEEILMSSVDSFKEPENQTRVLYEWEIFDPRTGVRKFIDFAFTDAASAHLSWLRYRGGLELKVNPKLLKNGSNTASGTVSTLRPLLS